MAASNGSAKMNGSNGSLNGHVVRKRKPAKKPSGWLVWAFATTARLATWYAIFTILVRCPSTVQECDDSTSFICERYFQAKEVISPRIQPYYNEYAGPYIEVAKPYYDAVNSRVLTPVRESAVRYGAPWVEKGQQYAITKWEQTAQPQLVKFQVLAQDRYEKDLEPYLAKGRETVGPYYEIFIDNSSRFYQDYVASAVLLAQPYTTRAYDATSNFASNTAMPYAYWTYHKVCHFVDTALWPQLRALYVENVEPQLVRIGERLGRYRNKTSTSTNNVLNDFTESIQDKATASASKVESPAVTQSGGSANEAHRSSEPMLEHENPVQGPPAVQGETEKRKHTREMVAEDLALWQNKFAAQADEGAADMEDRVSEIAQRMMSENIDTTGKTLVSGLWKVVETTVDEIKSRIISAVDDSNEDVAAGEELVVQSIRSSGIAVREKFQEIRDWQEKYDADLQDQVVQAAETHFQILDETRSLALQQIGQKWAWADGVTYKDWAKYHELKSTFTHWTEELKERIVSHPTLLAAQDAAKHVVDDGMEAAAEAAKELTRLKEVARYKIMAGDLSNDFDLETMKLAAEAVLEAKKAAAEAAQRAKELERELAEQAKKAEEEAAIREAQEAEAEAAQNKEEVVITEVVDTVTVSLASAADVASSSVSKLSDGASSVISDEAEAVVPSSGEMPSSASTIAEAVSSLASEAANKMAGNADDDEEAQEGLGGEEDQDIDSAPSAAKPSTVASVKPAFLGAAAQAVPERQPILDDYIDTDAVASATEAAQNAYSKAVSRASEHYSSATSVIAAQVYGTPKPVHEQLLGSVVDAYNQAVSAAGEQLKVAKEAAKNGIYGKPTPTTPPGFDWARVEAIATQRLNEGRLWAEIQYSSALIALGLATPTPTPLREKYLSQAKLHYYAGLGLAQERYASFMSAASSIFPAVTPAAAPTPTNLVGTAASLASAARESVASAASAAGQAADSAYTAATNSLGSIIDTVEGTVGSVVEGAAEKLYDAGANVAETWESVLSEMTARIYGDKPLLEWYDSFTSDASSVLDTAGEKASSAASAASESAASASGVAQKQYETMSRLIAELIYGKEPSFTESVLSRFRDVYATASANIESMASEVGSTASVITGAVKETLHLDEVYSTAAATVQSMASEVGSAASAVTDAVKETLKIGRDEL